MDAPEPNGNGAHESLPPPPPIVPPDVVPLRADSEPVKDKVVRVPMSRRGLGSKGQKIPLLTNHFKVNVTNLDGHFTLYSVCSRILCWWFFFCDLIWTWLHALILCKQVSLFYEDGRPVEGKGIGRKLIDRLEETYESELNGKKFAYDGEKSLFTLGALPRKKHEFDVVLEDAPSSRLWADVDWSSWQFYAVVLLLMHSFFYVPGIMEIQALMGMMIMIEKEFGGNSSQKLLKWSWVLHEIFPCKP